MTRYDIAKFISRIFSIYALFAAFSTLKELFSTIPYLFDSNLPEFPIASLIAPVVSLLLYLLIGFLLWIKADYIANKFIGDSETPSDKLIIEGQAFNQ